MMFLSVMIMQYYVYLCMLAVHFLWRKILFVKLYNHAFVYHYSSICDCALIVCHYIMIT